jgi:tetratricopeptide (TPR) repeat protein
LTALYLRKGELGRAEAAAEQGLRHLNGRGAFLVAVARGELSRAEKLKAQYLDLDAVTGRPWPTDRFNYYCRGLLALSRRRAEEALGHFREALRRPPLSWNVDGAPEDCLAEAYLGLGRLDEAIAEYERLLRLNPHYALAHYHLGQAYERKGERERARAAYSRFLESWKSADSDIPEVIAAKTRLAE